ncbi:transposase [Thalassoglobus polymorphus]|uniref:Transposase IS200 like protein n=1 Tax=Thalassoglobus polymorphus TaxID=2527994 RepID=A0A517QV84_9PLAN|nr:transposase [Thalassoglobus polymorphus]QDT35542.1 Transposase IS200 like protein [Thalassoglobus polymorphus]
MSLNLPTPPGFRGLLDHHPIHRYQRNLPHWRQEGASYFVTFNLADAVPAAQQQELESIRREWLHRYPHPRDEDCWIEYAKTMFRRQERIMDASYGCCLLGQSEYAEELHRAILHFHEKRYEIGCFVVMANHCHLIIRPFNGFELENELGAIKRASSRFICEREKVPGPLWQDESYDRIIRDEEHLWRVVQYIGRNPLVAKIPKSSWHRWLNPAWKECGWKFEDEIHT